MHWLDILNLIERLLGAAQAVAPVIEQSHPGGPGTAAKIQEGLAIATAATAALKNTELPGAAATPAE
jgi:hypothetical protein